jgi:hypothetical protein
MGTKKKKSKSTIRAMQKREWTQDPTQPGEQTEFLYAVRNDDQAFYVRRTAKPRNLTDGEMVEFLSSYLDPKCICRIPQPEEYCTVVTRFGKHSDQQQKQRLRDTAEKESRDAE